MKAMTERQVEIFEWVKQFIEDNKYAPSLTEIGKEFGMSPKGADDHLRYIEKKGYLKLIPGVSRGIVILPVDL